PSSRRCPLCGEPHRIPQQRTYRGGRADRRDSRAQGYCRAHRLSRRLECISYQPPPPPPPPPPPDEPPPPEPELDPGAVDAAAVLAARLDPRLSVKLVVRPASQLEPEYHAGAAAPAAAAAASTAANLLFHSFSQSSASA